MLPNAHSCRFVVFFFNDTATTEIYTLSLHDALPISGGRNLGILTTAMFGKVNGLTPLDRKSTRLNSSHDQISYAVFCLKKTILLAHVTVGLVCLRPYHSAPVIVIYH